MKKQFCLLMLMCFCSKMMLAQSLAQPNLKFGKPTEEEMSMSGYAPDKDAKAVVLCHTTRVWYDVKVADFLLIKEVKKRIKILKSDGKDFANVEIPYYEPEAAHLPKEVIMGLKASSFNMENGKMVQTKMENASVSKERIDKNHMLLKFSVPKVKEGTVIEYQYRKESDYYYSVDDWYAQSRIPVAYTQYELTIPEYFKFDVEQTGTVPLESKDESVSLTLLIGGESLRCSGKKYIFTGHDMPAMEDDGYVSCVSDYYAKVTAELSGLEVPGSLYKDFTDTWEHIGLQLMNDEDFGRRIKHTCPINDLVPASGADKISDVKGKMAAITGELYKRLKWDGNYGFYGQSVSKTIKNGTGDNADLNFILLSAFQEAGLDARPVVMSRRNKGRLPITHPSLSRLNTFVVGVLDGENVHFVDASAQDGYIDVLPSDLLTNQALMLGQDKTANWVNLQSLDGAKYNVSIEASLSEDGKVDGKYKAQLVGNAAASLREAFRQASDSVSFVNETAEKVGVSISDFQIEDRKNYTPTVMENYSFTKTTDATADHIYFNPLVIPFIKDNPFKSETRLFPVEFPYKQTINANVVVHLPANYTIEEKPQAVLMKTDDNGVNFRVNYIERGNDLVVQYRLMVNKMFFPNDEYEYLRQIFDSIQQKGEEMLVLKKNE